jgi:hypothetical protein
MKQTHSLLVWLLLPVLAFGMNAARGDDDEESDSVEIKITAAIQAVDTAGNPNTIKLLGLTIAVPPSALKGEQGDESSDEENDSDDGNAINLLSQLSIGQNVTVVLTGDTPPLTASELKIPHPYEQRVVIQAPVQSIDTTAKTITLLGLKIDTSQAIIVGTENDEDMPASNVTLMVGQNVEVVLDPAKLPNLVALTLKIENFHDQVEVDLENQDGSPIADDGEDVNVEVTENANIVNAVTGQHSRKHIVLNTATRNNHVKLAGLPPGRARMVVTRHGKRFRKTFTIVANTSLTLTLKVGK